MPRAKTNKLYRTFVKGMVTEASPLTYPEDSSTSELNTVLSRKGNRARRKGIKYEDNYVLNNIALTTANDAVTEYVWHSVAKISDKRFVVVQIGSIIHFWNVDTLPVSNNKHAFTLNLEDFKAPLAVPDDVRFNPVTFSSGAGYLFIAHSKCDPIVVEYDKAADTFLAVRLIIQIRDFEGVYDGLPNDAEPAVLSNEHRYNLMNQGWVVPGGGTIPPSGPPPGGGSGTGSGGQGGTYYDPYTGKPVPYWRYYNDEKIV